MLAHHLVAPTPQDTLDFLQEHLQTRRYLLQVAAECEVTYPGRAMSTAEAGDYLSIIKPDETAKMCWGRVKDASLPALLKYQDP